jgi:hypothetical protein
MARVRSPLRTATLTRASISTTELGYVQCAEGGPASSRRMPRATTPQAVTASVTGGSDDTASGVYAAMSGGGFNAAQGPMPRCGRRSREAVNHADTAPGSPGASWAERSGVKAESNAEAGHGHGSVWLDPTPEARDRPASVSRA